MKASLSRSGFTLIELLIVIMVLGILAMIIVPQITISTEDAKESTLQTNLLALRNAVELYYNQHANTYPGAKDIAGADPADAAAAQTAFLQQLTRYTEEDGTVSATKTAAAKFGPYIRGGALPTNSFNNLNTIVCDIAEDDITVKASGSAAAWKFYVITGILMADDGAHDAL
ncbi:MAG: type II secretion system protein [Desulfobacterium sp.]|nr:type II secretion system protein [Desulfobacterium sp.]